MSTTELLTCPFCGSNFCETKYLGGQWQEPNAFESGWRGECSDCGALTRAFPTEAEAIEAWNTRAERTCEYVGDEISGGCSECRGWLDPACAYCPSCGAKVMER